MRAKWLALLNMLNMTQEAKGRKRRSINTKRLTFATNIKIGCSVLKTAVHILQNAGPILLGIIPASTAPARRPGSHVLNSAADTAAILGSHAKISSRVIIEPSTKEKPSQASGSRPSSQRWEALSREERPARSGARAQEDKAEVEDGFGVLLMFPARIITVSPNWRMLLLVHVSTVITMLSVGGLTSGSHQAEIHAL